MSEVAAQSDSTFSVFPFHYLQAAEFCIVAQSKSGRMKYWDPARKIATNLNFCNNLRRVDPDILFLSRIQQVTKKSSICTIFLHSMDGQLH